MIKFIFSFCLLAHCISFAFSQNSFFVTLKGDTIKNLEKVWIENHSHPQMLNYSKNKIKYKITSDSLKFLFISTERNYTSKNKFGNYYSVAGIKLSNGKICSHFTKNEYCAGDTCLAYGSYCYTCGRLRYYVLINGQYITTLSKSNFKEVLQKYFNHELDLTNFSKRKFYNAYKLSKILKKIALSVG